MRKFVAGAAIAALVSSSLSAQAITEPVAAAPAAVAAPVEAPRILTLAAGTPIMLAVAEEVNSSTHKAGDTIKLTVLNDISADQKVVIPRGTPASAEITWRTGKGAFGKSGKIEFSLRSIDLDGKSIPVSGNFRQEGEGNTVATGVGVIAIGVFAGFITGKRARLPVGRELMSQLAQPVPFNGDGSLSGSFDWKAALTAAETKTEIGRCRAAARSIADEKKREKAMEECYTKRME